jgi:hypothetical protein
MKRFMTHGVKGLAAWAVGMLFLSGLTATSAWAIPALQIYIDGATYDDVTESWIIQTNGSFDLWVIGDIGAVGSISDVKLAAAVSSSETGTIGLAQTTTNVVSDPSTPIAPTPTGNFPSADGAIPVRGDGSLLPAHGIYGPGSSFFEWELGDMTLTDSPVGDFIDTFPTSFPSTGQLNVYTVSLTGFTQVHFDTYDHIYDGSTHGEYKFAPFSHDGDADAGGVPAPEPSTMLLLGTGIIGMACYGWRRQAKQA